MPESIKLTPETTPPLKTTEGKPEHLPVQYREGDIVADIIFNKVDRKGNNREYYNSFDQEKPRQRKMITLAESSFKPEPNKSYQVKILKDTKPENPLEGKFIVKIVINLEEERKREEKLISLAQEVKQAFDNNDFSLAVQKLKELKAEKILKCPKNTKKRSENSKRTKRDSLNS